MQRITRTRSIVDREMAGCAALRIGEHVAVIVAVTPLNSFPSYLWEKSVRMPQEQDPLL